MKNKTIIKNKDIISNQRDKGISQHKSSIVKTTDINPVYTELAHEGHEDFYSYLDWLGLAKKPDLLILTSSHHYYFEVEDLKNVKTVVNLNKLNSINRLQDFLQAIYSVLYHKCYFIGSFTDYKKQKGFLPSAKTLLQIEGQDSESEMGPWSSFLSVVYGLIDLKTNRYLTEKTVRLMLEDTGLKILDMTEFNGLTYFCTQKDNPSVE